MDTLLSKIGCLHDNLASFPKEKVAMMVMMIMMMMMMMTMTTMMMGVNAHLPPRVDPR